MDPYFIHLSLEPAINAGQVLGIYHLIHSTISTLAILTQVTGRFYLFLLGVFLKLKLPE